MKERIRKTFGFIRAAGKDKRNLTKTGKLKPAQAAAVVEFLAALRSRDEKRIDRAIGQVNEKLEY